ncbi:MAG: YdcF family protein [Rhizobiales bacterium]|nr:YdcF family protein [Hyphomicrobiales bacterium]OJY06785.1 MAG: hypothetical protein BGP07_17335 [Rhizobiales bacterium 63-22]
MTLNLILIFVVLGVILWCVRWRKTGALLFGLAVVGYGSVVSGVLPHYLMDRLQSPYSSRLPSRLEDGTVFVLFGLGTQTVREQDREAIEPLAFSYPPILKAAVLYGQCRRENVRCRLVIAGGDVARTGVSEAAAIAGELERAGVDPAAIVLDENSRNTWENARNTAALLRGLGPSQVFLVQSAPMMTRDLLYLSHFGVRAEPVAAGYLTVTGTNLSSPGLDFLAVDLALHEQIGLWRYAFYSRTGWNEPKQPPAPSPAG